MSLKDADAVRPGAPKRVALVVSNPAVSTTTKWPVGFWWSELTHEAGLRRGFAVRDANLITGQRTYSGAETATVVIAALGE